MMVVFDAAREEVQEAIGQLEEKFQRNEERLDQLLDAYVRDHGEATVTAQ